MTIWRSFRRPVISVFLLTFYFTLQRERDRLWTVSIWPACLWQLRDALFKSIRWPLLWVSRNNYCQVIAINFRTKETTTFNSNSFSVNLAEILVILKLCSCVFRSQLVYHSETMYLYTVWTSTHIYISTDVFKKNFISLLNIMISTALDISYIF